MAWRQSIRQLSLTCFTLPIRGLELYGVIHYSKDIIMNGIICFTLYLDLQTLTTGQGFDVSLLVEDTSAKEAGGFKG